MKRIAMFVLGILVFAGYSFTASATPVYCGERGEVAKTLAKSYSENPTAMGLSAGGGMIEVFSSKSGTWTIVITQPTGVSCIVAAGENWESLPQVNAGSRI